MVGYLLLTAVHLLAGAAWFGAMVYSFFILQPRARHYFLKDREYEDFLATVSHGARWLMLTTLGVIGSSGVLLTLAHAPRPISAAWAVVIGLKGMLFVGAVGLFAHVSWRLWPARVFATVSELPRVRRVFFRAAVVMITVVVVSMVLGVIARVFAGGT